jgi:hypothetical protein
MQVDGKPRLVSRTVMSRAIGRELHTDELVHHKDGDPFNNEIDNLELATRAEHKRIHADVGLGTRLQKRWSLDPLEMARRLTQETAESIARGVGCSARTVMRAVKLGPSKHRLSLETFTAQPAGCQQAEQIRQ